MVLREFSRLQRMPGISINPAVWADFSKQLGKLDQLIRPSKIKKMSKKNIADEISEISGNLSFAVTYLRNRLAHQRGIVDESFEEIDMDRLDHRRRIVDEPFEEIDTE